MGDEAAEEDLLLGGSKGCDLGSLEGPRVDEFDRTTVRSGVVGVFGAVAHGRHPTSRPPAGGSGAQSGLPGPGALEPAGDLLGRWSVADTTGQDTHLRT